MTRIGIISDTHLTRPTSDFKLWTTRYFGDVDMIIHAGDMTEVAVHEFLSSWNLRAVSGNMDNPDLRAMLPAKRIEEVEGRRIGIVHGKGPAFGVEHLVTGEFTDADIVVFGHSHIPRWVRKGRVYLVNPGSYRTSKTMGILELGDDVSFRFLEVG